MDNKRRRVSLGNKQKMKRRLAILSFLATLTAVTAQNLSMSFTSCTDARFFFYVNGKLQNEHSSGTITIGHLEPKDYHIRIVADDPYQVAYTKTMKPNAKHCNFIVDFNPVKEKIFVREEKELSPNHDERQNNRESRNDQLTKKNTDTPVRHDAPKPTEIKSPKINRVNAISESDD